jgi:hypothetical protein
MGPLSYNTPALAGPTWKRKKKPAVRAIAAEPRYAHFDRALSHNTGG